MVQYFCQHCEKAFPLRDGESLRCPTCLRTTGLRELVAVGSPSRGAFKLPLLVGGAVVAVAVGAGAWLYLGKSPQSSSSSEPAPGSTVVASPVGDAGGGPKAETPPVAEVVPVADPSAVGKAAKALVGAASDSAGKAAALAKALHARLQPLADEAPLGREVLAPDAVASKLLAGKEPIVLTGVEAGATTIELAKALGLVATAVILLPPEGGKTSVRHRDIGVRIKDVPGGVIAPLRSDALVPTDAPDAPEGTIQAMLGGLMALRRVEEHKFDEGADLVGQAMAKAPGEPALKFLHGQLLMLRGQLDPGLEELQSAVQQSEDAFGRYQLGMAFMQVEKTFKAYEALHRSTELYAKYAGAWTALGQLALDRLSTAADEQKAAVDTELDQVEKALVAIGADAPGLVELRVQRLMAAGKDDEAKAAAEKALAADPKRVGLHGLLAELAKKRGDAADAAKHLEAAAQADTHDATAALRLAELHASNGKMDEALKAVEEASKRAPYDANILAQLAAGYQQAGKKDEAKRVATDLTTRFPDQTDGPVLLSQLALSDGDTATATKIAEDALKKHPKTDVFYVMLYLIHATKGEQPAADEVLKRFIALDPDGRLKIAQELLQAQQYELAVSLMEEELKANPDRTQVALTLAQLYHLQGKPDDVKRLRDLVTGRAKADEKDAAGKKFDETLADIDKRAKEHPPEGEGAPDAPPGPPPSIPEAPPVGP